MLFSSGFLNSTLQLEIKTFLYYDMISRSSLFSTCNNFDFIGDLVRHFEDEVVLPGDFIIRKSGRSRADPQIFQIQTESPEHIQEFITLHTRFV